VFANIVPYCGLCSWSVGTQKNFRHISLPLPFIIHPFRVPFLMNPPLGRCSNQSCSFGDSCQAFYAADGARTDGMNPLPLKCLCGCFGMQHVTGAANGGDPPATQHIEVCVFALGFIISFTHYLQHNPPQTSESTGGYAALSTPLASIPPVREDPDSL